MKSIKQVVGGAIALFILGAIAAAGLTYLSCSYGNAPCPF